MGLYLQTKNHYIANQTHTASAGFIGNDSFLYKANDGLYDSNPTTVTIAVGKLPPEVVSGTHTTWINTGLNDTLVTNNAGLEGNIEYILVTDIENGQLTFNTKEDTILFM